MFTWKKVIATAGGAGYIPIASGTWGALVGLLVILPFQNQNPQSIWITLMIGSFLGTWFGAYLAARLEKEWGEDPKEFVWDEVIGMWVTLIGHSLNWKSLLVGFLLFRFFDIFKPLGIRKLESLQNGWGVMLDDVAAGFAASILLFIFEAYLF